MNPDEVKAYVLEALSRASNFKRVDLQIHSDESGDFPRAADYGDAYFDVCEKDKKPVPAAAFLEAAAEKHLDLIAITDHMKSRKSCEIAALSQKQDSGLVALAAIEVNVALTHVSDSTKDAVHLLCIFKEGKSPEDIEQIFHGAQGLNDYDQRTVSDVIHTNMTDFVAKVHKNDGICIASHVNAEKGLRRAFFTASEINYLLVKRDRETLEKQESGKDWTSEKNEMLKNIRGLEKGLANQIQDSYLQFLVDAGVDAVQIQKSAEGQFYKGEHCEVLGIPPIAAVLTSDAHCLPAIGYEKKITFVKMTRTGWDDLSLALKDPEVRIRYADTVGAHTFPKIKGIVLLTTDGYFKGSDHGGKTKPQALGFADNLTCFIGGRGAGKSAAIDALRFVFKDRAEVELLPAQLKQDIYGRLEHALKDTTVLLLLESEEGEEIVVKSFYSGWEKRTSESRFLNGEDAGVNLSTSAKYKAEIYGWNEIETLGTDSKKQLGLLDRFIESLRKIVDSLKEKKDQLRTNRLKVIDSAKRLEQLIPEIKDFEEARSALERINTPEMQSVFSEIDKILENKKVLGSALDDLTAVRNSVSVAYDIKDKLNEIASKLVDVAVRDRVFGINGDLIDQAAGAHSLLLSSISMMVDALGLETKSAKEAETLATGKLSDIAGGDAKNLSSIDKRRARKARYDDLLATKEKIGKEREMLIAELSTRDTLLSEYENLQFERSGARAATKDEINKKLAAAIVHGPTIAISFASLGDRDEFERRLGTSGSGTTPQKETGILKNVGLKYMERRIAKIISSKLTPSQFVTSILDGKEEDFAISHPDGKDSITLEDSKRIFAHLNPRNKEFGEEYFFADKLQTLLELQEIELDDHPEITLDGQPITNLSPGQRCSALVPIILLQGNHPLIIDQPEDNLDNRLVFDLIVEILRNLKESRQMIIATHNPNIPVSGDAEQIVVFESIDRKTGRIAVQGSIDDPEVIEAVKDIMEGGDEAFLTRAKKYRYELRL
jgi:DNA repair ATPase RecN